LIKAVCARDLFIVRMLDPKMFQYCEFNMNQMGKSWHQELIENMTKLRYIRKFQTSL